MKKIGITQREEEVFSPYENLGFGLSRPDATKVTKQILEFSNEANYQKFFPMEKTTRALNKSYQIEKKNKTLVEIRDSLDQRWMELFSACELEPLILPNHLLTIERYLASKQIQGLILSGGNHVHFASQRNVVERRLLEWAKEQRIPVLGVCRGMQILQVFFGGALLPLANHVNTTHLTHFGSLSRITNSYHHFGIREIPDECVVLATCSDGTVESMRHKSLPWHGIMWHPEREPSLVKQDLELIQEIFQ